jgi:Lar family restriction alleviation protein
MKKAIELLERAGGAIMLATAGKPDSSDLELCTEAVNHINEAMALLSHLWETPKQYEKRTGEKLGANLLPCPFCGSEELTVSSMKKPLGGTVGVLKFDAYWAFNTYCSCGARGTEGFTEEEAVKKWNKRIEQPASYGDGIL